MTKLVGYHLFCYPYKLIQLIDRGKAISYQLLLFQPIWEVNLDKNLTYMIRKYAAELLNSVMLRVHAFFKLFEFILIE